MFMQFVHEHAFGAFGEGFANNPSSLPYRHETPVFMGISDDEGRDGRDFTEDKKDVD